MAQSFLKQPGRIMQLSLLVAGLLFTIYLSEILFIADPQQRLVATDITTIFVDLAAVVALGLAARQCFRVSRRLGFAWLVIATAQSCYFIGDIIWAVLEAGLGLDPFPSAADGFYLAYYPLLLLGILMMPGKAVSREEWVRKVLDNAMIMVAAVLIFWNFIIGPFANLNAGEPLLPFLLSLAYPCGDLLIFAGLLILIFNYTDNEMDSRLSLSFMWLSLGLLATIVTDTIFSIQTLSGTYESGRLLDLGWTIAYLLTGIAGMRQVVTMQPGKAPKPLHLAYPLSTAIHQKVKDILPYIALVSAFALLILRYAVPMPMDFFSIAVGVSFIIAMVLVRQINMILENRRLVDRLNLAFGEVQQQSAALEQSNEELQAEITERERIEHQLAYDALHDSLTGLPNRAMFLSRLEHAILYGKRHPEVRFSVLFLDLDHFKVINDSLGHTVGDNLLIALGQRLTANLRSSDTVARLGGDEFVILLEEMLDETALLKTVDHIKNIIAVPFHLDGHNVFTTASIGIVGSLTDYAQPEEVLRDADIAMYGAKSRGKACQTIFSPDLRSRAIARLEMENELHRAIEGGEFALYYQPIYSLSLDQLAGFEALIRWNHPTQGLLLPGVFLDIAEESGLILPIGQWVLHQACQQMHAWHQHSREARQLTVSVNISSNQFAQPIFVDRVAGVLQETGLDPQTLKLEITENVIIHNPAVANEAFRKLAQLGIQLQVDDFGTGYSSLSHLQHYPFQGIKIDRSFIQGMHRSGKNYNLVRTMVRMAHDLGMEAVAEGIETEEQKEFLQSLDCQFGQGFLFSKAVDAQSAAALIRQPEGSYPTL